MAPVLAVILAVGIPVALVFGVGPFVFNGRRF